MICESSAIFSVESAAVGGSGTHSTETRNVSLTDLPLEVPLTTIEELPQALSL